MLPVNPGPISSEYWEGVNWALHSGDYSAMRTIVKDALSITFERLNCKALLLPECGHAYYATRYALERWFPESLQQFKIYTVFDLLLEYVNQRRIILDPARNTKLATFHDSCNYGRKSLKTFGQGYFDEARTLTRALLCKLCGPDSGSGRKLLLRCRWRCLGKPLWSRARFFHGRMKARQISTSGAKVVVTACQNCRDQLQVSLKREFNLNIDVCFLWELVAKSLIMPRRIVGEVEHG